MNSIYKLYALIFARRQFFLFNKLLYNLALRGLGIFNYQSMLLSGEKNLIDGLIRSRYKKKTGYVVFDVGGNIGKYAKMIAVSLPASRVFVFEPGSRTFKRLQANVAGLTNVSCLNVALSSRSGTALLHDYSTAEGSTHASLNAGIFTSVHGSATKAEEVLVRDLDGLVGELGVNYIDLLKIDVEGYELEVLKGAARLLQERSIEVIQFEFTQLNSTVGVFFRDFFDLLAHNYALYRLLPSGLLPIVEYNPVMHEIFGYQNYIAILRD